MPKISTDQSYAGGNIAFIIVVAITYIMIFSSSVISGLLEVLILVGLGLAFLLLGLFGSNYFYNMPSRLAPYLYFALLVPLGFLILYLSNGMGWLILMPVVSQAVAMLPRRGSYLVNAVIFGMTLMILRLWGDEWMGVMRNGLSILAAIIFVAVFTQIAVSEQKARTEVERLASELEESNRKQREYAAQVETLATVQERNRLAREIHDGLGHYLTTINMQIKAAQAVVEQDRTRALDALEKARTRSAFARGVEISVGRVSLSRDCLRVRYRRRKRSSLSAGRFGPLPVGSRGIDQRP
jgi:signal transduction histidine kinase